MLERRPRARTAMAMVAVGLLLLLAGVVVYFVGSGQSVQVSPSLGPPGTNPDEFLGFVFAAAGVFFLFIGFVTFVTA